MVGACLPHLFTLGNLFCGLLALHFVLRAEVGSGSFAPAAWLIMLGAMLDKIDGLVARRMRRDSQFGIELDSLTDVCTFGVAPAMLIYRSHLSQPWGLAVAFVFLVCGALRLARFNVLTLRQGRGAFYMGLPIPVAAVCLTQFVVFSASTWQAPHETVLAAVLTLALAGLMVSPLSYDPMPDLRATGLAERGKQAFLITSIGLVLDDAGSFLFPLVVIYIFSGIYRRIVSLFSDEVTQHA